MQGQGKKEKAKGGKAKAYSSDGGHANAGNVQFLDGNALALWFGKELRPALSGKGDRYDRGPARWCRGRGWRHLRRERSCLRWRRRRRLRQRRGGDGSRPLLARCGLPGRRYTCRRGPPPPSANLWRVSSRRTRRPGLQTASESAGALAGLDELAVAKADDRPNVLLIVVDTLRADHSFGKRTGTPNIDALAREGLKLHELLSRGDSDGPARQVNPQRSPRLPIPRLVLAPCWTRAGLGADRRRHAPRLREQPAARTATGRRM